MSVKALLSQKMFSVDPLPPGLFWIPVCEAEQTERVLALPRAEGSLANAQRRAVN